jgi:hypothetical protein
VAPSPTPQEVTVEVVPEINAAKLQRAWLKSDRRSRIKKYEELLGSPPTDAGKVFCDSSNDRRELVCKIWKEAFRGPAL